MKTVDSVCCGLLQVWSSQIKDTETIFVYIIYILLFLKSNQNFYLFIKLFEHFRVQTSLSAGQERNQPQFLLLTCIYSEWSQPLPCPQSFNKTSLLRSADNPSRLSLFFSVPFLCWCSVCLWLVSALSLSLTHTHAHTHTHTHTRTFELQEVSSSSEQWNVNERRVLGWLMAGFKNGTRDSKDQPESQCRDDIMNSENDM